MNGRMRNWILPTALLVEPVEIASGREVIKSHRLQICVAFDELFRAASRETYGDSAIVLFAFHTDYGSNAIIRVANFLAEQRIGLAAAFDGRAAEGTRGCRAPLWRAFPWRRRSARPVAKLLLRVRILRIGFVAPGFPDFRHRAAHGFHKFAGDFTQKARGQGSAHLLLVAKNAAIEGASKRQGFARARHAHVDQPAFLLDSFFLANGATVGAD